MDAHIVFYESKIQDEMWFAELSTTQDPGMSTNDQTCSVLDKWHPACKQAIGNLVVDCSTIEGATPWGLGVDLYLLMLWQHVWCDLHLVTHQVPTRNYAIAPGHVVLKLWLNHKGQGLDQLLQLLGGAAVQQLR